VTVSPLSWVVRNWRLKLLALLLAMGLLGGVAFSENPPAFATVAVRVGYVNLPPDLVIINPPQTIDVDVAGLRDTVAKYKASAAGVNIDLARARAGANQTYYATPRIDVPGVQARQASIKLSLTIERLSVRQADVEVRVPKPAPGTTVIPDKTYAICGSDIDRCQVTLAGPASVVDNLKPFVNYDVSLTGANRQTSPGEPIQFDLGGHVYSSREALQRAKPSLPAVNVTPDKVTVQVATQGGVMTKTVGMNLKLQGTQACGYAITGVDVQPGAFASVTGPIDVVSRLNAVSVDSPISVAGISAAAQYTRGLLTGSAQVNVDPATIHVTVNVAQQFVCAAPTPAAGAVVPASPTPATPTPRPT
jgi:YbbR domain-containing protein